MNVTMKTKMFKCQNSNSNDKESDREVSDFLSNEDSCDEWLPENYETECLNQKQPSRGVLQK